MKNNKDIMIILLIFYFNKYFYEISIRIKYIYNCLIILYAIKNSIIINLIIIFY